MKGKKTGGRKKGTPNKATNVQQDLLESWEAVGGPETAKKLLKAAIEEGLGKAVTLIDKLGKAHTNIVRDWEPLRTVLPYIARKVTETSSCEVTDSEGKKIKVTLKLSENA